MPRHRGRPSAPPPRSIPRSRPRARPSRPGVGLSRAWGPLDLLFLGTNRVRSRIGFPAEALPMALLRPLSGSGALGVMAEIVKTHGPDSFVGNVVCTLQGSTETTFYVLTLYYGAVGVRNMRYTLAACLVADLAGFAA